MRTASWHHSTNARMYGLIFVSSEQQFVVQISHKTGKRVNGSLQMMTFNQPLLFRHELPSHFCLVTKSLTHQPPICKYNSSLFLLTLMLRCSNLKHFNSLKKKILILLQYSTSRASHHMSSMTPKHNTAYLFVNCLVRHMWAVPRDPLWIPKRCWRSDLLQESQPSAALPYVSMPLKGILWLYLMYDTRMAETVQSSGFILFPLCKSQEIKCVSCVNKPACFLFLLSRYF